jgi:hypothetical protein
MTTEIIHYAIGSELTDNRLKFIKSLKENSNGYTQIFTAELTDGANGRCAIGLGAEGLGIVLDDMGGLSVYPKVTRMLNIGLAEIWNMNDKFKFTFDQIARELEVKWNL